MYRIELSPGEETVFRSIEELAVAIKRGVVTARARIYHNASNKWLPIQFHPHYKAAVSMPLTQAALVAGPPVKPLSSLSLQQPADPEPPAPVAAPVAKIAVQPEQPTRKKRTRLEQPAGDKRSRRHTKSQRQLRIALIGALLVGGAQWVLSAPLFERSDAPALLRAHRHLITAPAEAMMRVSSPNTAGMVPVIRTPSAATAPASFGGIAPSPAVAAPKAAASVTPVETAATPEIEPAPSAIDVSVPTAAGTDSVTSKMADSTKKKAMKGILRAVSGSPTKDQSPTQH